MLVTVDQVNQYEESDNCKRAKKVFQDLKENRGKPISQKDFVAYRDHIFFKTHFSSAHRSGVTANMTLVEFKQREIGDDGMIRVNVKDHKTVDTYGSAPLMLYRSEFEWISTFSNNVQRKISTINTSYVFISWNENKRDDIR